MSHTVIYSRRSIYLHLPCLPGKTCGRIFQYLLFCKQTFNYLSINESVASLRVGTAVDGACQRLTASFVRAKRRLNPSLPSCAFYEKFDEQRDVALPKGVYNLVISYSFKGQALFLTYYFSNKSRH